MGTEAPKGRLIDPNTVGTYKIITILGPEEDAGIRKLLPTRPTTEPKGTSHLEKPGEGGKLYVKKVAGKWVVRGPTVANTEH